MRYILSFLSFSLLIFSRGKELDPAVLGPVNEGIRTAGLQKMDVAEVVDTAACPLFPETS
jgi:hypothetical protein